MPYPADDLDAAERSACYTADSCVDDPACPFAATCALVEAKLLGDVEHWQPIGFAGAPENVAYWTVLREPE